MFCLPAFAVGLGLVLAATAPDLAAQDAEERFQFGGWLRSSLEAGLTGGGHDPGAPDPLARVYRPRPV